MFKKSLLLLGWLFSVGANAGMYQTDGFYECKIANVTIPCVTQGYWNYGGDALYLKPTNGLLQTLGGSGPQFFNLDPYWGFKLEGDYHFSTGKDVAINWLYFIQDENVTDTAGTIYAANTAFNERNRLAIINLELGQEVDLGEDWFLRVHGGLQYAGITARTWTLASVLLDKVQENLIGARAGLNIGYSLWGNVAFYANGALGLLYGDIEVTGSPTGGLGTGTAFNGINISTVTEIDYDIGLTYSKPINQGSLVGKAGWVAYSYGGSVITDYAWQGLILGVKWMGNP